MQIRPIDSLPPIGPGPALTLAPGEVHIWYVLYDDIRDPALLAEYHALMSQDERERHARFVFARDRRQYLITRALVRTTLSRYAPVAPHAWRFVANAHGKPDIAPDQASGQPMGMHRGMRLRFNLSNTHSLIACAVTASSDELGVDVESTERAGAALDIADRFFSAFEVAALRSLPAGEQAQRFFVYWTLKESYIKARGMGLAIPLEQFSFHLGEGQRLRIAFDPRLPDVPDEWQFELFGVSSSYLLAMAVRRGRGPDYTLCAASCVPLCVT